MFDAAAMLKQLIDHQVNFVVVGGLAMVTHGSAYTTEDLDICYQRTPENLAALVRAIAPLRPKLRNAPADIPFLWDALTLKNGLNFTLDTNLGELDILGEVSGIGGYDEAVRQSQLHELFGSQVKVLSIAGLIAAKTAAGRRKDLLHLLELREMKKLEDEEQA